MPPDEAKGFGEQMRALREAFEQHRDSTARYREESAQRQQKIIEQQTETVHKLDNLTGEIEDVKKTDEEIKGTVKQMDTALRGDYGNSGMVGKVNGMAESQASQKKWLFMIGSTVILAVLGAILRKVIAG